MKKATREWLEKADEDLRAVEVLATATGRFADTICFHCQQAVDKKLKAVMCELGLTIPRIHDLAVLGKLLSPHLTRLARFRRRLSRLSEYAVEFRYPAKHATPEQAQTARSYSEELSRLCETWLASPKKRRRKRS